MDVEEAKRKKEKFGEMIREEIISFEKETGLEVMGISLDRHNIGTHKDPTKKVLGHVFVECKV